MFIYNFIFYIHNKNTLLMGTLVAFHHSPLCSHKLTG